ncbi:MAG: septum formation initiator family protein [Gammaproteobacteria bacterium]
MKIVLAILIVVLVALQIRLWRGEGSLSDIERLEHEIASQTATNAGLDQRNKRLLQQVSDLKTGLDSVEEHARSEMGLIKKGETYYLIVDKNQTRSAMAVGPTAQ